MHCRLHNGNLCQRCKEKIGGLGNSQIIVHGIFVMNNRCSKYIFKIAPLNFPGYNPDSYIHFTL